MGFGSGGGGFTPSPNNVPGSTTTGTDKDTDTHQFTGSVDITGSLTLNGSSITGGGGGGTPGGSNTQVQYNDAGSFAGSSNLVFDGTTLTANQITGSTHISTPKLGVNTPVGAQSLFVIGETRLQGTTYASHIPLASGAQSIFLRPGTVTGDVVLADSAATQNVGVGTSTPTAKLHVSSSGGEPLFRVDQDTQTGAKPILFITGSGLVGIGTAAPRTDSADTNRVHIMGEGGADQGQNPIPNALLMLENNGPAGIQFMTPGSPTSNAGIIAWGGPANNRLANLYYTDADNRYTFEGPGFGNKRVMTLRASGDSMNVGASNSGHMITAEAALHISSSTGGTGTGGPVLLKVDHANAANVLFVTGSGRVGIGTGTPLQTLSVGGSAAFSGTYGSTAIETRDTNLQTLSATDGVAIINLTSAAVNTSFTFLIDNGTYTGQEKIVYFKTIIGADGANSNDATLQGTNIDSPLGNATGLLGLSGSDDGSGFFGYNRAAARLLWDGTDWAPISVTNLSWNQKKNISSRLHF